MDMDESAIFDLNDAFGHYKRAVLQTRRVGVQQVVAGDFVRNSVEFRAYQAHMFDSLMVQLTAHVLSDHLVHDRSTHNLDVPASWWQHLKMSHAPGWFTKRWPVKCKAWTLEVYYDRFRTYPEANVILPKEQYGRPFYVETVSYPDSFTAPDGKPW